MTRLQRGSKKGREEQIRTGMRGNWRRGTKKKDKAGDIMKTDESFPLDECEYCYILLRHHGFIVPSRYDETRDTLLRWKNRETG